ncbi:MAG: tRNA-dihydrouridine synthase, partial [Candidatus Cloacimonetes bacterium]|nr:tRNA-dihydrouridine synthase [Candidatus Cloacimonadota bacterium]
PELVAECLVAMQNSVSLPISVKHRIGVDEYDSEEHLHNFVKILSDAGVRHFIVHARKAWLKGLSPAENRKVPPLRRDVVHRLKKAFPHLFIETNGEIKSLNDALDELKIVDGVMIGRAAQDDPWLFAKVDSVIFNQTDPFSSRLDVLPHLQEICLKLIGCGQRQHQILRHVLGLFHKEPGARNFRRFVTEESHKSPDSPDILIRSAELISAEYRRIANSIQKLGESGEI